MNIREQQPGTASPATFGQLPVNGIIGRSLRDMGYTVPTPIQERSIPLLRDGRDVLAQAQTGTGKTAGFGIPLIEHIDIHRANVQAIVLVPTRELCLQVADELRRLSANTGVRVAALYGGVGLGRQMEDLRKGVHAVVGTPGRVEDLIQRGVLDLSHVRMAILDEADRMLDVGFLPAIERILKRTPSTRQTGLFSATIPNDVRGLAHRQMRDPVTVAVDSDRPTVDAIEQVFQRVTDNDKLSALQAHLDNPQCYLALVFRRTTYKADRLTKDLTKRGYKVAVLHGRRTQNQRERVVADLRAGKIQALVATDIAARGLDINGLTHVFNYDLPDTPETYVHRIGRTGRAGEAGTAITLVGQEDEPALRELERYLARQARPEQEPLGSGRIATRPTLHRRTRNGEPARPRADHRPGSSPRRQGGNDRQNAATGPRRPSDAGSARRNDSSRGRTRDDRRGPRRP